MGPFLGRKRRTNQLVDISTTRNKLKDIYAGIPDALRCKKVHETLNHRPDDTQLQAVALSLAYENLQIVLHRQLLFAPNRLVMSHKSRQEALGQLFESALCISSIAQRPIAREFYSATHAAMHIGICALTSGIVLCGLLLDNPLFERKDEALLGVQRIIDLFAYFSERNYQLAGQGSRVLSVLKRKVMIRLGVLTEDMAQDFLGTQTSTLIYRGQHLWSKLLLTYFRHCQYVPVITRA